MAYKSGRDSIGIKTLALHSTDQGLTFGTTYVFPASQRVIPEHRVRNTMSEYRWIWTNLPKIKYKISFNKIM